MSLTSTEIINKLERICAIKNINITEKQLDAWLEQIKEDLESGKIKDIGAGFEELIETDTYGKLDYTVFIRKAKIKPIDEAHKVYLAKFK